MKKKLGMCLLLSIFAFLLTACNEILSVITVDEDGNKVVNNYVASISDTALDETASLKTWRDLELIEDAYEDGKDSLLFAIEDKKQNLVVFGDEDTAFELKFNDEGYDFTYFESVE